MCDLDLYKLRGSFTLEYYTSLQSQPLSTRFFLRLKTSGGRDRSRSSKANNFSPRVLLVFTATSIHSERRLFKRLDNRHHFPLKNVHTRHCACVSQPPQLSFLSTFLSVVVQHLFFIRVDDRDKGTIEAKTVRKAA